MTQRCVAYKYSERNCIGLVVLFATVSLPSTFGLISDCHLAVSSAGRPACPLALAASASMRMTQRMVEGDRATRTPGWIIRKDGEWHAARTTRSAEQRRVKSVKQAQAGSGGFCYSARSCNLCESMRVCAALARSLYHRGCIQRTRMERWEGPRDDEQRRATTRSDGGVELEEATMRQRERERERERERGGEPFQVFFSFTRPHVHTVDRSCRWQPFCAAVESAFLAWENIATDTRESLSFSASLSQLAIGGSLLERYRVKERKNMENPDRGRDARACCCAVSS